MITNLNLVESVIDNGSISLESSLVDYPLLTVVEYNSNVKTKPIGSKFVFNNLTFTLESFSIDINPLNNIKNLTNQVTYSYTHVTKQIYEYPIKVKDFYDENKSYYSKQTEDSFYFSIGLLCSFAMLKNNNIASINCPPFLVEIKKNPTIEDTITLRELIDNKLTILNYVYKFENKSLSFEEIGVNSFVRAGVVSNINLAVNSIPTYKNTLLLWSKKDNYDNDIETKKYIQIKESEYITYEGSYNPHIAPPESKDNSIYPRDLSIMFDNSGETKECKITKYKWNQPDIEISAIFGYAHAALELIADPTKPNASTDLVLDTITNDILSTGNAYQEVLSALKAGKFGYPDDNSFNKEIVWRLISIKETKYIYEPFQANISPQLKNEDGTLENVVIPNEYQQYLISNIKVLVREETTGWELKRFAQEDASNWTNGSIASWLSLAATVNLKNSLLNSSSLSLKQYNWMLYKAKINLEQYLYRKIPLWERVDYKIEPYTKYYTDFDDVDWDVKYIPKNELNKSINDTTLVPVLFPDPNWEPNLMVVARSRLKTSIGLSGNPNYNPWSRNYFGSNPVTITTGSEEYEFTKYTVLPSKNTRPYISQSFSDFANISNVISSIESGLTDSGTYYTPHTYMDVNDYGINSNNIPAININNVNGVYPADIINKEDQYSTVTSIRVAQDHSYKSRTTQSNFSLSDGRPPRATLIKPVYEEARNSNNNPFSNSATYITSNIQNTNKNYISSINISYAENLQEALKAADFKLVLDNILNGSTVSGQLNFSKNLKTSIINSKISIPKINGTWIIKRCVITVQYSNKNSFLQPTVIEAGNFIKNIKSNFKTTQILNTNNLNGNSSLKPLINPNLPSNFGTPIDSIPPNFSRWLDNNE